MALEAERRQVARWASALTLGQSTPIQDSFKTKPFFTKPELRIHYAAVFNGATAQQIHNLTSFQWLCCIEPNDLKEVADGKELVEVVEARLRAKIEVSASAKFIHNTAASGLPLVGKEAETDEQEGGAE